jgi:ATP-dependent helicase Lhr and Lhr-like helicase
VTAFDLLHPALQHHVVNTLGWRSLRPLQEQTIQPLVSGRHALLLAPTAGGKTEAAFFPILSQMLTQNWSGLSMLYICPIKALLNNLETRLAQYCEWVGRRCALWHGDIKDSVKKELLSDSPDCLLTTPESLEVILLSSRANHYSLFRNLQAVIVDEVHSFAGDDRGWHLLSVLERIKKIAGKEIQRVGLSATVGNPGELLDWLAGMCEGEKEVIALESISRQQVSVQLDYVGSLQNAATVISRLHRGEKRLVFCDSRSRVEQLAALLRNAGVATYVSHSSLSLEERQTAEAAFSQASDCVIVATSTLELGVDVGDLDRVIQIDAPNTASSFLQRMGRTGRRAGMERNCLFLATSRESLLQAAAIIELWKEGVIEPVIPPPLPFHIFAQQVMALALQERGIGVNTWREWIGRMPGFTAMSPQQTENILQYMIQTEILSEDNGILWLGEEGEDTFGRRNFLELFSVFTSPPLISVRHGQTELGSVDVISFFARDANNLILLLGGRSWQVTHIEWGKRIAWVRPIEEQGRSKWLGSGPRLSFKLCQAICRVLSSTHISPEWSRRAQDEVAEARSEYDWVGEQGTAIMVDGVRAEGGNMLTWWTFGGLCANRQLAESLKAAGNWQVTHDNLTIKIQSHVKPSELDETIAQIRQSSQTTLPTFDLTDYLDDLKFSVCLPNDLIMMMMGLRLNDEEAVGHLLSRPIKQVHRLETSQKIEPESGA